jgi:hypothetical protein
MILHKCLIISLWLLYKPINVVHQNKHKIYLLLHLCSSNAQQIQYKTKRKIFIISLSSFLFFSFLSCYFYFIYIRDPFSFSNYECIKDSTKLYDYENNIVSKEQNNLIKVCQNKVPYENELAVWSMISDDHLKYAVGAAKLLKSLDIHSGAFTSNGKRKFDALIMMLAEKPLESRVRVYLESVGWRICQVSRIAPRDEANTYGRFRDQFTKLNLWLATEYTANYYLDADTLIVSSLVSNTSASNFFNLHTRLNDKFRLGATRDFREQSWHPSFNLGVFVLKPDSVEFARLIRLKNDPQFKFETTMSEQGFLNVVYEKQWFDIGFENNANLVVYKRANEYWRDRSNAIRVIHFTMVKPWSCDWVWGGDGSRWWWGWKRDYERPCNLWRDFDHCSV